MPSGTANYAFVKAADLENYDVAVVNANLDAIDTTIKAETTARGVADTALGVRIDTVNTELDARFIDGATVGTVPRCKMQQTGVQTTATGVGEVLLLAAAATVYDTDTMTSSKATNVLTIKHAGWYTVAVRIPWTANAAGDRSMSIKKNGATVWEDQRKPTAAGIFIHTLVSEPLLLAVNDTISVDILQSSGGTLTTTTVSAGYPSVSITYLPQ